MGEKEVMSWLEGTVREEGAEEVNRLKGRESGTRRARGAGGESNLLGSDSEEDS